MSVSPLAVVEEGARLGSDVTIGPFTVVHANVEIGDGCTVASHCVLGAPAPGATPAPLRLGPGATIRSHSVLYEGSTFGPRLETGHHVTMRDGLEVGENLRAGTLCDLQGDARIGDFVRFQSNVLICKHAVVGDYVWIFPSVVMTNDPHPPSETQIGPVVEDYAVIATNVVLLPGTRVGRGALVSAGAVVTRDLPPGQLAVGAPAKPRRPVAEIELSGAPGTPAYPWRAHYHHGFPDDVVARWAREGATDDASVDDA